jgi:predicted RNA-binding Zn-ribbon protein involved in translation (DUF1610 family)
MPKEVRPGGLVGARTQRREPRHVRQLTCPICGNTRFTMRRSLLNTRALTFLDLDWANRRATNFVCQSCGHILWFVPQR